MGFREELAAMNPAEYAHAAKAAELRYWDETTRYCAQCGTELERATEISKRCPGCGKEFFPYLYTCVIVLVRKGEEALLVHAKNFKRPFYGLVAGFVETGETLEEAVRREVKEETSLDIKNIKYAHSQAWPFPSQMMIGFTAEYAGGEIAFADGELSEGGWFTRENHPPLASPPSIARRLIDEWLAEKE